MAEQPNITAILAALAAQQRPASATPQQATSSSYPPQGQYQQQQPQNVYSASQFGLPQPSNSGSLDLSNIKPVSSGNVSIAEAVAKARAIAAERGVMPDRASYGQPIGRQPQRDRSRSPPRRDGFRGDFAGQNPYRDERRNDRPPPGRDVYGRERSFSPQGRGRGGPGDVFSPARGNNHVRDRSPARRSGGENENLETIQIESHLVGLIIGRQGENLRRVEGDTGCRVQFITGPDETGPYRQCKITGPPQRRQDAKNEINRIIDESGMGSGVRPATVDNRTARGPSVQQERAGSHQPALRDGEDSMQIMVPDRTVGLIIGRGGETIRDLQERSGCHVNIVGENKSVNGLRPVNLIGSREAAAKAKDLIMEIVESDSKSQSEKRAAAPQSDRGPPRDNGYSGVPAYGSVGGASNDKPTDSIFVPSDAVGMIIGKGGETIKDMQNTTNCKINVTQAGGSGETEREIILVGTRDCINAAKQAIMEKVEAVQAKNNGGGGSRRGGHRDLDYDGGNNNRGYQQQQQQPSYGAPQSQQVAAQGIPAGGAEDPYAAYGGYQNYVALWYQAMAAQGGQGTDPSKPPGAA